MPVIKDNHIIGQSFAGIFNESNSKASIVSNYIDGASKDHSHSAAWGLGILFLAESGGMVGKNSFENFSVSPIMVFSTCHPLIRDNDYSNVSIDDEKQKELEKAMLQKFKAELFKEDEYFYIVDCSYNEKQLQDVILKGPTDKLLPSTN